MSFKVVKSGFLATIQDYGRLSHGKHGMSHSGVMDEHAYSWANYLLGNNFNAAVIEICFGGFELESKVDTFIIVTGADSGFQINGESASTWHSIQINKGDILSWNTLKSGVRSYLAVKGGFQTKSMFDSRSVNLRENIGEKIQTDDVLKCDESHEKLERFIPPSYIPNYTDKVVLRLLPAYQFNEFSINQRDLFFNQKYTITNASDRAGCRLSGAPIALKREKTISEGMSYGSVEISTDGLPIILLKDAPTIGGYPKIGTVFSLDLAKLAQRQPNTKIRFELMSVNDAQIERRKFNNFFKISES